MVMERVGATQAPRTRRKYCTSRRQRVPPLLPLHLPLPRYCHAAAGWLFGLTLHHLPTRPRTVQGVCSPSHLSRATCPAQPSCSGRLGTPKASCLQTKPQPIASSPADLSAEGKAKLSLDVLLFILLGFPDRQAGAQGVQ